MVDDFVYVITRGRVTGRPHEIEIWYARDGDTLYLLSGGGDRADWVRNLVAEPKVGVRLDGVEYRAGARLVSESNEDATARRLVFEKYQPRYDGSLDGWRSRALPVAIDLVTST